MGYLPTRWADPTFCQVYGKFIYALQQLNAYGVARISESDLVGEIREIRSLKVSKRGDGLSLYLPKQLCELHSIKVGDRLKVQFREHYRLQAVECASLSKEMHSPLGKRERR